MSVRPTFFGLEIAKTGLFVSQKGLDVTGHNVANADTEGYTRQRLVNTAYEPYSVPTLLRPVDQALVGGGAHVMILDQIRDQFLDRQYRTESSTLGYWSARTQGLTYVEGLFEGEETANLTESLNSFFTALNVDSNQPESGAFRTNLRETAQTLITDLNLLYERLEQQQLALDKTTEILTSNINDIAAQIADLNGAIYRYEIDGQPANDLRDKRNLLVDKLSEIVDIEYGETGDPGQAFGGKFWLSIGGVNLVNHISAGELRCVSAGNTNIVANELLTEVNMPVWVADANGGNPGAGLDIKEGKLKATIDLRDSAEFDDADATISPGIPYFMEQLNNLARAVVQEINDVHYSGWTSSNAPGGSHDGVLFFNFEGSTYTDATALKASIHEVTAGNIRLDQAIMDDLNNIAASEYKIVLDPSDPAYNPNGAVDPNIDKTTHEGNQVNVAKMYSVIQSNSITLTLPLPSGTVSVGGLFDFLDGIINDVAVTLNTSKSFEDARSVQTLAVANQRESVSGVNLDEEMTNLIKYQHAYGSAARVITAMDEALDVLINKMGVVGR
ncbi:MAG: flagellar hook-associated protein FlgK [Oscillospiraceae bacterium]|jgi:flagellar hook-associated protein 1 FlgK|nr:flagellar hook-associated protein FlgK [Oscillospiraceae bacterium]